MLCPVRQSAALKCGRPLFVFMAERQEVLVDLAAKIQCGDAFEEAGGI